MGGGFATSGGCLWLPLPQAPASCTLPPPPASPHLLLLSISAKPQPLLWGGRGGKGCCHAQYVHLGGGAERKGQGSQSALPASFGFIATHTHTHTHIWRQADVGQVELACLSVRARGTQGVKALRQSRCEAGYSPGASALLCPQQGQAGLPLSKGLNSCPSQLLLWKRPGTLPSPLQPAEGGGAGRGFPGV